MRNLLLTLLAILLLGSSAGSAQPLRTGAPRNPQTSAIGTRPALPSSVTSPVMLPVPGSVAPGTIPTPIVGVLGALSPMPGTAAAIAGGALGSVTTCAGAPSFSLDASSASPFNGALTTPPLPGATVPPNPSFGSSIASGGCNPVTGAQDALEALGVTTLIAPIPGLATVTTPTYTDATVPTTITEAGPSGFSPLIVVPSIMPVSPCTTTIVPPTTPFPSIIPTTTPSILPMPTLTPAPSTLSATLLTAPTVLTTGSLDMTTTSGLPVPGC